MSHTTRRARWGALGGALAVLLALLAVPDVHAQATGTVTGRITDGATDDPVPGATVRLEGTTRGASADVDGNYTIENVPAGSYTLRVSFVGYRSYETQVSVAAGQTAVENITITVDRTGLDEVVVTGQGSGIERKRLSTTVTSINPRDIEEVPALQLEDILQANLPDTQVRFSSGQPGTASLIRSRGVTSANGSTTPVIYVDGVRVDNLNSNAALEIATGGAQSSAIADIPVENIERIEFIKGGAATTLYGSDAANGVLQIFTKTGVPGQSQFSVETELGVETGTRDYLRFAETGDILFDPGFIQGYRLSGNGGAQGVTYSFSGRIFQNEGYQPNAGTRRYDLRTSVGAVLNDVVRYQGSFAYASNFFGRNQNANSGIAALGSLEIGDFGVLPDLSADEIDTLRDSVLTGLNLYELDTDVQRFQTSQQLDFSILPNLDARVIAGLDYRVSEQLETVTNEFLIQQGLASPGETEAGSLDRVDRNVLGLTLDANVSHRAEAGLFSFVTQVGGQLFRDQDEQIRITSTGVTEGSGSFEDASDQFIEDFTRTVVNYGVYAAENVGIADRLFVDIGGRLDGNTAFGDAVGTVFYPRFGAAYTLSDEAFFQRAVPRSVLSNLKFRANYGEAGNFPTPFANDRTIAVNTYFGVPSFTFGNPGDPNLKPERIQTYELGLDLGLFDDRLFAEVTYFDKTTTDALFAAPFSPSVGQNSQVRNLGEIVNKGIEANMTAYLLETNNYSVRLNGSVNTLTNEVTDIGGAPEFSTGGFSLLRGRVVEGQPVGVLIAAGLPTLADDGSIAVATEATTLGDTEIAAGDLLIERNAVVGNPLPDVFGTLGLTARVNRFTFVVSSDYQLGGQAASLSDLLAVLRDQAFLEDPNGNPLTAAEAQTLRNGFASGDPAALARIAEFEQSAVVRSSGELLPARSVVLGALGVPGYGLFDIGGLFVENTDYLKIRQISASYSVPPSYLSRLGGALSSARVQLAVTNPFNFVSSSFDPETTGAGIAAQDGVNVGGFGYGTESSPRQFLVTLGATF